MTTESDLGFVNVTLHNTPGDGVIEFTIRERGEGAISLELNVHYLHTNKYFRTNCVLEVYRIFSLLKTWTDTGEMVQNIGFQRF